ncbi:dTMP kinase [Wenzhouxiangella sp. XN79A]|uniref:dTMP kinase n=1 Tax=Wenzhouxiangella sp. XN79A TaxID=2724193 RepID=UPI00144ADF81|nr:dTMP kinase [Wenzhouxiangella sp. XN79A]NKI34485.1 dTMP kinase [Wenzhouxiangella sp. XN79A]
MSRGRLITLEGGEGAGKTTAIDAVVRCLEGHGRSVHRTREPGGTPAAEKIRGLLLDPATGALDPLTELLLMFAARRENVVGSIEPALAAGQDVVCDRFTEASHAYQGGGRGLGPAPVEALGGLVHPDLEPDLVLVLDVPVEVGLARIRKRGDAPDRFEGDRVDFLERVRRTYLERAAARPDRFVVIDASQAPDAVRGAVVRAVEKALLPGAEGAP